MHSSSKPKRMLEILRLARKKISASKGPSKLCTQIYHPRVKLRMHLTLETVLGYLRNISTTCTGNESAVVCWNHRWWLVLRRRLFHQRARTSEPWRIAWTLWHRMNHAIAIRVLLLLRGSSRRGSISLGTRNDRRFVEQLSFGSHIVDDGAQIRQRKHKIVWKQAEHVPGWTQGNAEVPNVRVIEQQKYSNEDAQEWPRHDVLEVLVFCNQMICKLRQQGSRNIICMARMRILKLNGAEQLICESIRHHDHVSVLGMVHVNMALVGFQSYQCLLPGCRRTANDDPASCRKCRHGSFQPFAEDAISNLSAMFLVVRGFCLGLLLQAICCQHAIFLCQAEILSENGVDVAHDPFQRLPGNLSRGHWHSQFFFGGWSPMHHKLVGFGNHMLTRIQLVVNLQPLCDILRYSQTHDIVHVLCFVEPRHLHSCHAIAHVRQCAALVLLRYHSKHKVCKYQHDGHQ